MSNTRKRYALIGTGGRAKMFVDALVSTYRDTSELVAIADLSQTRMDWYNNRIAEEYDAAPVPTYHADQFDQMIAETKPDTVIVTTMDSTHHIYINRAMTLGCDAISEKPMTIDAAKARSIFETIDQTGQSLRVTFNYRYAPIATKVRELLMEGVVGRPLHVNFQWVLDTFHGADYFRRWHREKDKSGGLMVHKATHHFDLINWWLASHPKQVFAYGDLLFYGKENAANRGESYAYSRYTGEAAAANDPFALRLDENPVLRDLYYEAEKDTGYQRDRNVFGENITVEDTMSVTARYRNDTILTYSLIAYSPWEGYKVAITGDKGRLEVDLIESVGKQFIAGEEQTVQVDQDIKAQFGGKELRVYPMFGRPYTVEIPEGVGGHGGGDRVMLEQIFAENPPADPFNRAASHIDGAASILLGIAANESMATGQPINVDDLLPLPTK
ncbi:MAG TPA: Gfo/Idh/MocA family oxidoreductase [Caldilineaceae bacterium]|nr:Gfo/Idh/MocA family oxidoreductase [Caldilineaceae bacterium]